MYVHLTLLFLLMWTFFGAARERLVCKVSPHLHCRHGHHCLALPGEDNEYYYTCAYVTILYAVHMCWNLLIYRFSFRNSSRTLRPLSLDQTLCMYVCTRRCTVNSRFGLLTKAALLLQWKRSKRVCMMHTSALFSSQRSMLINVWGSQSRSFAVCSVSSTVCPLSSIPTTATVLHALSLQATVTEWVCTAGKSKCFNGQLLHCTTSQLFYLTFDGRCHHFLCIHPFSLLLPHSSQVSPPRLSGTCQEAMGCKSSCLEKAR